SVKNSTRQLRACPLADVERTIRSRSENCSWQGSSRKSPISPAILQRNCRNSCKTLQILLRDFQRFANPLNGLGIFHGRQTPVTAEREVVDRLVRPYALGKSFQRQPALIRYGPCNVDFVPIGGRITRL